MKRVLTAVVLIPLVLMLIFKSPLWLMSLVLAVLAYGCVREFELLSRAQGIELAGRFLRIFVTLPFLCPLLYYVPAIRPALAGSSFEDFGSIGTMFVTPVFLLAPFFFVMALMFRDMSKCLSGAAASVFGLIYIGGSLFSLWLLWLGNFGSLFVLHLMLVVWSGDISAYYVGKNLGRHKLAPQISPGKTWEGTVASFFVSVALGTTILVYLQPVYEWLFQYRLVPSIGWIGWSSTIPQFPLWFAVAASALVNIAAQFGDLVESALKRAANVKDSGTILPGHGGLLDRIDALLFAGPVAMLVFAVGTKLFRSTIVF